MDANDLAFPFDRRATPVWHCSSITGFGEMARAGWVWMEAGLCNLQRSVCDRYESEAGTCHDVNVSCIAERWRQPVMMPFAKWQSLLWLLIAHLIFIFKNHIQLDCQGHPIMCSAHHDGFSCTRSMQKRVSDAKMLNGIIYVLHGL